MRLARWVEWSSWAFLCLGLALPVLSTTPLFSPYRTALAQWAFSAEVVRDEDVLATMLGITGGSIAGKWAVHALLARGPLREGAAWARRASLAGLISWFLIDSGWSLFVGASFNVVLVNLLPLLVVGVPLAMMKTDQPSPGAPRSFALTACLVTCALGASAGLVIALGARTPVMHAWFAAFEQARGPLSDGARRVAELFCGPIGGCTLAQFVMLALAVRFEASPRIAVMALASLQVWFVTDSAWAVVHRAMFTVWTVNVPFLVLMSPAWVLLWTARRRAPS